VLPVVSRAEAVAGVPSHVVGLLPRPQQEGSPVRAQRVPGDQHGIGVKVAGTGPGYSLRVVDSSPCSRGYTHLNTPRVAAGFPSGPAAMRRW